MMCCEDPFPSLAFIQSCLDSDSISGVEVMSWTPRHVRELRPTCAVCGQVQWKHVIEQVIQGLPTHELPCPSSGHPS